MKIIKNRLSLFLFVINIVNGYLFLYFKKHLKKFFILNNILIILIN